MDIIKEEWRSVQDFVGFYEVSNLGRVRSLDVVTRRTGVKGLWHYKGAIKKQTTNSGGYKELKLGFSSSSHPCGKSPRGRFVHRLVWDTFGDRPRRGNEDIDHINGDKTNNRIDNLRPLSRTQNMVEYHKRVGTRGNVKKTVYGTYQARFNLYKRSFHLGTYSTPEDARMVLDQTLKLIDEGVLIVKT